MSQRRALLITAAAVFTLAYGGPAPAAKPVKATKAAPTATAAAALTPEQVDLLIAALKAAPQEGFAATAFPTDGLDAARTGDAAAQAKLKTAVLAYARAQHGLSLSKDQFDKNWGLRPAPYDAAKELDFALAQNRLQEWVASLPPPFQRYRQLREGLVVYGRLSQKGWKPVAAGPDIGMGATGERVTALRARLIYEDGGLARTPLDAPFDQPLQDSVKRFQARHGLNPTGLVSNATLGALNATPGKRVQQIRANMERWRWVPRDLAPTRVEANTAAGFVQVYDDNKPTLGMLAAAGKPGDESPILQSKITSIVLNPAWHVPASIAPEIYAKQRKDKGYFEREGFSAQPGNTVAPLVQAAGPKSALGQVKFDFANSFGVYLHDTPGQAAFTHSSRDVSHGCVRVEKPVDLAAKLLAPNGDWPQPRIEEAIKTNDTQRVSLKTSVAVYLFYFTAYGEGAQLSFRADPYGWDAKLLRLLDAGAPGSG